MSFGITSAVSLLALASGMRAVERSIICSDGIRLAAQQWKSNSTTTITSTKNILCLHGWLDNSASFHLLAPSLISKGCASDVVALDLHGHGKSSHKSIDGPTQLLAEYAYYVAEAAEKLYKDEKFTLIGHSMGAGISIIFAAAWPEKIEKLVLLEGLGPLTRNARDFAKHVRTASEKRMSSNKTLYGQFSNVKNNSEETLGVSISQPQPRPMIQRIYPTLEKAIETRVNTARLSPGKQYISKEAAEVMVKRSTAPAPPSSLITGEEIIFIHDPRLNWPSLQYSTREQVEGLLQDIRCPTCLILAENGWPINSKDKKHSIDLLRPEVVQTFPGSHHLHADPEYAEPAINFISAFLSS